MTKKAKVLMATVLSALVLGGVAPSAFAGNGLSQSVTNINNSSTGQGVLRLWNNLSRPILFP